MDVTLHEGSALTVCIRHIDIYTIPNNTTHIIQHYSHRRHAWYTRLCCMARALEYKWSGETPRRENSRTFGDCMSPSGIAKIYTQWEVACEHTYRHKPQINLAQNLVPFPKLCYIVANEHLRLLLLVFARSISKVSLHCYWEYTKVHKLKIDREFSSIFYQNF